MSSIRVATPYDAEAMAAVHEECFDRPWSAREIDRLLEEGFGLIYEDVPAFLLGRVMAGEAEILTVAVAPYGRRQGYGARLVQGAQIAAEELGAEVMFLEVAADNAAAIRLYEQAGFEQVGLRPAYYPRQDGSTADALVMRKALTPV